MFLVFIMKWEIRVLVGCKRKRDIGIWKGLEKVKIFFFRDFEDFYIFGDRFWLVFLDLRRIICLVLGFEISFMRDYM